MNKIFSFEDISWKYAGFIALVGLLVASVIFN